MKNYKQIIYIINFKVVTLGFGITISKYVWITEVILVIIKKYVSSEIGKNKGISWLR